MRKGDVRPFWSLVDTSDVDGCWEWQASRLPRGYGQVYRNGKKILAHRYALATVEAVPVPTPDVKCIHSCDNPPCCNPDHLSWATQKDNIHDMMDKGRENRYARHGSRNPRTHLTDADVEDIRRRAWSGLETQPEIADAYGISRVTVSHIKLGRSWAS